VESTQPVAGCGRHGGMSILRRAGVVALNLLGELVAPTRCAACDELVAPRLLFCTACAPSVMSAGAQPSAQDAVFEYGGAVATAIVRFKYAGRSDLAARFAEVMAAAGCSDDGRGTRGEAGDVELVVPVPLHPQRLAERGFDQAALLAMPVARRRGIRCAPRALIRTRPTPPQASLDRAARSANVADAFVCPMPSMVRGRSVLLVDDVRTTGATLAACIDVLCRAGARDVRTLVLASRDRPRIVQKSATHED
jgi:ComF family protein